jgi:peptidyl-prolyl cis-trans isomerase C
MRAKHILVEKKSLADELLLRIKKGESFEKIAKEYSKCPSRKRGGDLGNFQRGQMVKPFEQAVLTLEKNGVTDEPIKTEFGWHIIKRID